jgi:RND family efflux transporter MFP subunit
VITEKSPASTEEASRLVVVDVAARETVPVVIRAMGTVRPAREATIRPRVSGMIVEQSPSFEPGGFVREGEFLLQIERTDYEQALLQRQSEVAQAEAALQIELGDQAVAREELELLEIDIPEINRDLILRIPQVNRARAELRSAEAAVERAELDLSRTRLAAPFDGHITERYVSMGNNVSEGDELAMFVGASEYWVELSVPVSSLRWIEAAGDGGAGSAAVVRAPRAWGAEATRAGEVARRVGALEEGSRLAQVIVRVPDPLAMSPELAGAPELILGAYVDVEIRGRAIENAVVIDRDAVREGDVVWVMGDDDRLEIRPVEIAYRGRDTVYVREGLYGGDRVVMTNLTAPVEGMLLRTADAAEAGSEPVADAPAGSDARG